MTLPITIQRYSDCAPSRLLHSNGSKLEFCATKIVVFQSSYSSNIAVAFSYFTKY